MNLLKTAPLLVLCLLIVLLTPASLSAQSLQMSWPDLADIQAEAWLVFDRQSKEVLLDYRANRLVYPASTTKIMTAILALEHLSLTDWVQVSDTAVDLPYDSSSIGLVADERIEVRHLLTGLMLASGNDAANVLAEAVAGDQEQFAERMNQKAGELGMSRSHFCNASGVHDDEHVTTVYDMALLADYALDLPVFRDTVSQQVAILPQTNKHAAPDWGFLVNTNRLLLFGDSGYQSPYIQAYTGIKTGRTPYAQSCLVASAQLVDGRELISVIMGDPASKQAPGMFTATRLLLEEAAGQLIDLEAVLDPDQMENEPPQIEETTSPTQTEPTAAPTTESSRPKATTVSPSLTHQQTEKETVVEASNLIPGWLIENPWRTAFIGLSVLVFAVFFIGLIQKASRSPKKPPEGEHTDDQT